MPFMRRSVMPADRKNHANSQGFWVQVGPYLGIALVVVASRFPLTVFAQMVSDLAGRDTTVIAALDSSAEWSIGLVLSIGGSWKLLEQRRVLARCKARNEMLKRDLAECQQRVRRNQS